MAKIASATFKGRQETYEFEVYPADTKFNAVGAVYMFTKRILDSSGRGTHKFLYIGQTDSLASRIPSHDKWDRVNGHGCNCICVHRDDSERSRILKESDLRAANETPCNDQ